MFLGNGLRILRGRARGTEEAVGTPSDAIMNTGVRPSGAFGSPSTLKTAFVTMLLTLAVCMLAFSLSQNLRINPAVVSPVLGMRDGGGGSSPRSLASVHAESERPALPQSVDVTNGDSVARRNPFRKAMKEWVAMNPAPKRVCPCCGWSGDVFAHLNIAWSQWGNRPDKQCPRCRSLERHRSACALFGGGKHPFLAEEVGAEFLQPPQGFDSVPFRMAHFGPEVTMANMLNKVSDLDQVGMDFMPWLYGPNTFFADITNIPLPANFTDGVVVLHVMEHIPALEKAAQEIVRIMRPQTGWALAEVPCYFDETRDCRDKNSNGRKECAGQPDHMWGFNCDDFVQRMRKEGLNCREVNIEDDLQPWATPLIPAMRLKLLPSYICNVA